MSEPLNTPNFQIWFGCLIFSVSILLFMLFLSTKGIYLHIGLPPAGIPHYLLKYLFIFSTCISGIYIIHYKFRNKGDTAIAVFFSFFILAFTLVYGLLSSGAKYTIFSSPNNQESFVVVETGHGEIYQMSNTRLFMKHLVNISTDDGFDPFSEGAYQLKWNKPNEFVIRYAFDYMTPNDYSQEVTIKYK
ncbi:hypothetical protein ACULLL_10705 [Lysinibacillus irui]|uniref:hypothetical protein n=1 Tax=Lysinibacillus irui TaxID=2998077 RepID=UPI00404405CD